MADAWGACECPMYGAIGTWWMHWAHGLLNSCPRHFSMPYAHGFCLLAPNLQFYVVLGLRLQIICPEI